MDQSPLSFWFAWFGFGNLSGSSFAILEEYKRCAGSRDKLSVAEAKSGKMFFPLVSFLS